MLDKTIKFPDGIKNLDNFAFAIHDIPSSEDVKLLRAYTDSSCKNKLPIDTSSFDSTGAVYVKTGVRAGGSFYLTFNGREDDERNDVWSGYEEVK